MDATETRPQPAPARPQSSFTFAVTVAYDGTGYSGWQVQPDADTVQGRLEAAAARLNGEPSTLLGAGRTDAGVHARGQVARFRTTRMLDADAVPRALNAHLPEDIVVVRAHRVDAEFHPIRDALGKHYRYTFRVAPYDDPFDRRFVYRIEAELDLDRMRDAARILCGRHDFVAFQKKGSPRPDTVRSLRRLDVVREGDYIHVDLYGDGFLYGMARNLVGTLLRVGRRRLELPAVRSALDPSGTPDAAGPCLPARGLCLVHVSYRHDESEDHA